MKAKDCVKHVPVNDSLSTNQIRNMYQQMLDRHPLLKEVATQQQIELPLGLADTIRQ
ncbi:hypothetical protein JW960_02165 [candidate division KSB1 bacterium]|nr:hypothetical protein [candidate division KSB1 bacterium]